MDIDGGADALKALAGDDPPAWAIVSGSGLAGLADAFETRAALAYAAIPGFAATTVAGHPGRLILTRAGDRAVWLCLGRPHFYEHASMQPIATFVRTLAAAGVRRLLLTNAAGAVNPSYAAGDVMAVRDHVFLPGLAGQHPLIGPNHPSGPRFPDMTPAYDPTLTSHMATAVAALGRRVHTGVYAMVSGPSYETAAEVAWLASLGADAVGMSTAPEAVVARHAGLSVAAASVITNTAGSVGDQATVHAAVVDVSAAVAPQLGQALRTVIAP